jgi:hypothetical protein
MSPSAASQSGAVLGFFAAAQNDIHELALREKADPSLLHPSNGKAVAGDPGSRRMTLQRKWQSAMACTFRDATAAQVATPD